MNMEGSLRTLASLCLVTLKESLMNFSALITLKQNGIVKRKNRTLEEIFRVMILANSLIFTIKRLFTIFTSLALSVTFLLIVNNEKILIQRVTNLFSWII